jgi:hypothetical protein
MTIWRMMIVDSLAVELLMVVDLLIDGLFIDVDDAQLIVDVA